MGVRLNPTVDRVLREICETNIDPAEFDESANVGGLDLEASALLNDHFEAGGSIEVAHNAVLAMALVLVERLESLGHLELVSSALEQLESSRATENQAERCLDIAYLCEGCIDALFSAKAPIPTSVHIVTLTAWAMARDNTVLLRTYTGGLIRHVGNAAELDDDQRTATVQMGIDTLTAALNPTSFADAAE